MERILKENWEYHCITDHITGVEMQNGNKYYLNPNCDGFVPVNLKYFKNSEYSDNWTLEGMLNILELKGNKKVFKFDSMQEMIAWATS